MLEMAAMHAGGIVAHSENADHRSLAAEMAELWTKRAVGFGWRSYDGVGRYIRVDSTVKNGFGMRAINLAEVRAFDSRGELIGAVAATMSSTVGEAGASKCLNGDIASICHTASDDQDPWLLVDYGVGGLRDVARIAVTNRGDCCEDRILGARIAITRFETNTTLWSAKLVGTLAMYNFRVHGDGGTVLANMYKENECDDLVDFCRDEARWPDTASFEYFASNGSNTSSGSSAKTALTQAGCDFALGKCFHDARLHFMAKSYYVRAGGAFYGDASKMEDRVDEGASEYTERIPEAAIAVGKLFGEGLVVGGKLDRQKTA
jgi:hypothetical protein